MPDASLYEDDLLSWTEEQVAALRSLAARPDLSNAVDWPNLIEEIESLGRREWKGVESQIRNALVHIIKGALDPDSLSRQAWEAETAGFLDEAREEYRRSMHQIDIDRTWQRAFKRATDELRPYGVLVPPGVPPRSPFSLEIVLSEDFSYARGVRQVIDGLRRSQPEL